MNETNEEDLIRDCNGMMKCGSTCAIRKKQGGCTVPGFVTRRCDSQSLSLAQPLFTTLKIN